MYEVMGRCPKAYIGAHDMLSLVCDLLLYYYIVMWVLTLGPSNNPLRGISLKVLVQLRYAKHIWKHLHVCEKGMRTAIV